LTLTVFATWVAWMKFKPNKMETVNKALDKKLEENQREAAEQGQPLVIVMFMHNVALSCKRSLKTRIQLPNIYANYNSS
jgi:hypothetical protein